MLTKAIIDLESRIGREETGILVVSRVVSSSSKFFSQNLHIFLFEFLKFILNILLRL